MDSWDWVYELIKPPKPSMELPEDVIIYMLSKNKKLQELIDRFDLDLIL